MFNKDVLDGLAELAEVIREGRDSTNTKVGKLTTELAEVKSMVESTYLGKQPVSVTAVGPAPIMVAEFAEAVCDKLGVDWVEVRTKDLLGDGRERVERKLVPRRRSGG